jgi:hypothetical protein
MRYLKGFLIYLFLFYAGNLSAQISSFIGISLTPGFSSTRSVNASYAASYSGGVDYILWENPGWYLKTGLEFQSRNSGVREIPKYFEVDPEDIFTPVDMKYGELNVLIPLQGFFPLLKKKDNAMLLAAGMEIMITLEERFVHDVYGKASVNGEDINKAFKTGIMLGAGYQRELSDILFLNIYPSVNLDIKADRPFTSFELTIELLYGVY